MASSELGDPQRSAEAWETCLAWSQKHLPPNDETEAVYAVQAAVSRLAEAMPPVPTPAAVGPLLARARAVHEVAHGGGAAWMAIRYRKELLEATAFPEAASRVWAMILEA